MSRDLKMDVCTAASCVARGGEETRTGADFRPRLGRCLSHCLALTQVWRKARLDLRYGGLRAFTQVYGGVDDGSPFLCFAVA